MCLRSYRAPSPQPSPPGEGVDGIRITACSFGISVPLFAPLKSRNTKKHYGLWFRDSEIPDWLWGGDSEIATHHGFWIAALCGLNKGLAETDIEY